MLQVGRQRKHGLRRFVATALLTVVFCSCSGEDEEREPCPPCRYTAYSCHAVGKPMQEAIGLDVRVVEGGCMLEPHFMPYSEWELRCQPLQVRTGSVWTDATFEGDILSIGGGTTICVGNP